VPLVKLWIMVKTLSRSIRLEALSPTRQTLPAEVLPPVVRSSRLALAQEPRESPHQSPLWSTIERAHASKERLQDMVRILQQLMAVVSQILIVTLHTFQEVRSPIAPEDSLSLILFQRDTQALTPITPDKLAQ
jgi:hypothetical protein